MHVPGIALTCPPTWPPHPAGFLIPISLYVTLEVVKVIQAMVFIARDGACVHACVRACVRACVLSSTVPAGAHGA